jgi:TPR repeat protein
MPSHKPVLAIAAIVLGAVGCGPAMARPEAPKDCDGGNVQDCRAQCDSNVPRACYRLGWFTEEGEAGVSRSPKEAVRLYEKSCQAGMAVACRALGTVYAKGTDDISADRKRSREYFQKACDLGIPEVCPPPEKQRPKGGAPAAGGEAQAGGGISIEANVGK